MIVESRVEISPRVGTSCLKGKRDYLLSFKETRGLFKIERLPLYHIYLIKSFELDYRIKFFLKIEC